MFCTISSLLLANSHILGVYTHCQIHIIIIKGVSEVFLGPIVFLYVVRQRGNFEEISINTILGGEALYYFFMDSN
jgi:hypothetical protein